MNTNKLNTFVRRLSNLNIDIKLASNYPWIYLDRINGVKVTEKYRADHGFTIAFMPIRNGEDIKFTDFDRIFGLIRFYVSNNKEIMQSRMKLIDMKKKVKDLINWAESELSSENNVKLGRTMNAYRFEKIRFFREVVKRLK